MSTVVITGANRGIGLELSRRIGEAGDKVIATSRAAEPSGPLRQIQAENAIDIYLLDVTDGLSVASFCRAIG